MASDNASDPGPPPHLNTSKYTVRRESAERPHAPAFIEFTPCLRLFTAHHDILQPSLPGGFDLRLQEFP